MSVQEITEVYEDVIPLLFPWWKIPYISPYIFPYSMKPLKTYVEKLMGDSLVSEFNNDHVDCIAGAVVREFNEDSKHPDIMRLFDSELVSNVKSDHPLHTYYRESNPSTLVREILMASSNAPIYFEIPSRIGEKNFIDGGVGGM